MLVPKCCKGCSGRGSGVCNCTLPSYCNEWVEDDGSEPVNYGMLVTTTPNTAPDITVYTDKTYPENKKESYDFEPTYEQSIGNWAECPNCKEKDHRIAVLEKALRTAVIEYDFAKYKEQSTTSENIKRILKLEKYVINQAEKELEEEESK